jgi:23S rRNA (cytosine1962-C5)-methyltransferase
MTTDHTSSSSHRLLATDYRLLDFGGGRRLEQFGRWTIDRPCPAAESFSQANPALWVSADARFERTSGESGEWTASNESPERWTIDMGPFRLELKRSPFGHLGVFAEQADNWQWIADQVARADEPLKVLNLFAYTGGSTLAAAAAGAAEVVHVDAAKNTVGWARRNADLSGLADAPVRWIAEDAPKFVRRELKRGNNYDAVILDPPSYGHGRRGEVWRLSKHLPRLLADCAELTAGRRAFVLLTAHTPDYPADRLAVMLAEAMGEPVESMSACPMALRTAAGRMLPSGDAVRWSAL